MADWYTIVEDENRLAQGDLLFSCPVPLVETYTHPLPDEVEVVTDQRDLVVITQTCDLENDKVAEVLLAAVRAYQELVDAHGAVDPLVKSTSWRCAAVKGDLPAYSLLPERSQPPTMSWSLVDFHNLFVLPKSYIEAFAVAAGPRLRLIPPYREHLGQAFARYMMRVGLPTELNAFKKFKPVSAHV